MEQPSSKSNRLALLTTAFALIGLGLAASVGAAYYWRSALFRQAFEGEQLWAMRIFLLFEPELVNEPAGQTDASLFIKPEDPYWQAALLAKKDDESLLFLEQGKIEKDWFLVAEYASISGIFLAIVKSIEEGNIVGRWRKSVISDASRIHGREMGLDLMEYFNMGDGCFVTNIEQYFFRMPQDQEFDPVAIGPLWVDVRCLAILRGKAEEEIIIEAIDIAKNMGRPNIVRVLERWDPHL